MADDVSLDDAPDAFRQLERALERERAQTTRSQRTAAEIRRLHETWRRDYRPQFAQTLGEFPAIELVDYELETLRRRVGGRFVVRELRRTLRKIAKTIDAEILPAYSAARWTESAAPPSLRLDSTSHDPVIERLSAINPQLAASYQQVLDDLGDGSRKSYLGPAGELREVLRASIHHLAPDDEAIAEQPWFKGHEGRPTQAERVRYILQVREHDPGAAAQAADLVDVKIGALGRHLYQRASRALHAGTEQREVAKIEVYVRGLLLDILPD